MVPEKRKVTKQDEELAEEVIYLNLQVFMYPSQDSQDAIAELVDTHGSHR